MSGWAATLAGQAQDAVTRLTPESLFAAAAGLVMLAAGLVVSPGVWWLGLAGAAAVVAALLGRWPLAGSGAALAAVAMDGAILGQGTARLPLGVAGGALILAYLIALERAEWAVPGGAAPRPRGRVRVWLASGAAALVVAAAATASVGTSVWLTVVGLAAAGGALLLAAG